MTVSLKHKELSASERNKSFITRETHSDLVSMVHGFLSICKRRVKNDMKSVTPAGINSDIVENFFCMQRTINHGSNSNPTVHQYKYAINATVLGQNSVSKKAMHVIRESHVSHPISHLLNHSPKSLL